MTGPPNVTNQPSLELAYGDASVTLRKVYTPNGERLEVDSDVGRTRLDALELESLTWQPEEFFCDLIEDGFHLPDVPVERDPDPDIKIGNEYTTITMRRIDSNGEQKLRLTSLKLGYATEVDARVFGALVEKPITFFSELLHTPYGPEGEASPETPDSP